MNTFKKLEWDGRQLASQRKMTTTTNSMQASKPRTKLVRQGGWISCADQFERWWISNVSLREVDEQVCVSEERMWGFEGIGL